MLNKTTSSSTQIAMIKPSRYTILVPLRGDQHLAYNTVSQAFSVWDADDFALWSELIRKGSAPFAPSHRPFMQGGYVLNAAADELAEVRKAYEAQRNYDGHVMLTIAPTLACNFACHYCFQGLDKPFNKMIPKVTEATKAYIRNHLEGRKSLHVTWYGGEPLMARDTIYDIAGDTIDFCDANEIKYSSYMISNGYHLTPSVAKKLQQLRVSGVQITIDGDEESHDSRRHLTSGRGSFARILENVKAIAADRLMSVSIRVNMDGQNETEARALLDILHENGLGIHNGISVYFAPVENVAEASKACDNCFSKAKYAGIEDKMQAIAFEKGLMSLPKAPSFLGICQAMRSNSYVIVPNGDLHKCWDTVMDPRLRVGSVLGNTRQNDAKTEALWNEWTPFDNPVCSSCTLLPSCAGFCAFKFVHNDYASGEAAKLPCPSWKFNMAEKLFRRAKEKKIISDADWDPELSPTVKEDGMLTGDRHSFETVETVYKGLHHQTAHDRANV